MVEGVGRCLTNFVFILLGERGYKIVWYAPSRVSLKIFDIELLFTQSLLDGFDSSQSL